MLPGYVSFCAVRRSGIARPLFLAVALASGLFTLGCNRAESAASNGGRPKVLRIALTVNEETIDDRPRKNAYHELAKYLEGRLNLPVQLVEIEGYAPTIEALRAGKLDLCTSSPMPYLVAQTKIAVTPLVVPAMPDGSPSTYYTSIITHPGSGLRTLEDVKARASSLTFAFADPASTSGHLIPRAHLESMGLNPEKDFKRVVFASNHTASVMTVKSGKVEVAAITKTLLDRMIRDGRVAEKELVVLWVSPPMHQSVLFARASLPADLRAQIVDAYVALGKERPDIWQGLRSRSTSGAVGYAPANDAMFDEFRTIARRLEHMKLLD